ncbi:hypothetical protein A4E84_20370 [Streptomyces qaidamensis]|uniref:Uncharacterized protein n=1 Tax=Streptomyces qaidamensis TaxID=1783515 RepID=A0A143C2P9_9ACTN|nr:hypothetical protein [Streptomyces qaidamensis]AMW11641.1 hypothetical protein A4E84_20370 [Streptomyces qaidamensis]
MPFKLLRRNQEPEPVRPWFARLYPGRPTAAMHPSAGRAVAEGFAAGIRQTEELRLAREEAARWRRHADSYDQERARAVEALADAHRNTYAAHAESAHLLAWLAALHPASAVMTPASDEDPGGPQVLYLVAGGWQMSWTVGRELVPLFGHVPVVDRTDSRAQWDGHGTEQKYQRIRQHVRLLALADAPVTGVMTELEAHSA